jgi:formylglycine-generating enzyme required for sulfatase activity
MYPYLKLFAVAVLAMAVQTVQAGNEPDMVRITGYSAGINFYEYELGKTEVTQAQWNAVMGDSPSYFSNCGNTCPVENVSWNDIQQYLKKLNAKTGKQYRLPTDSEWSYACKGGSETQYCGGNDLDALGWYGNEGKSGGNSNQTTHPVGYKQANGYGLYDMTGNVAEWTQDSADDGRRVVRGGAWFNNPYKVQPGYNIAGEESVQNWGIGFRLAKTVNEAEEQDAYDSQGGLTWMPPRYENWVDANSYCANTAINGQTGWRLPTKVELIEFGAKYGHRKKWLGDLVWSKTPSGSGSHYYVDLTEGDAQSSEDDYNMFVTCVR